MEKSILASVIALAGLWYWRKNQLTSSGQQEFKIAITGCDSGFGKLLVTKLLKEQPNCTIVAGCFTPEGLDSLNELKRTNNKNGGNNLFPFKLDVTKQQDLDKFKEFCESISNGQGWDAIVANAGITEDWLVEFTSMNQYRKVMEVNYFGVVGTCKTFLPLLKKSKIKNPRILIVASMLGRFTLPGTTAYSASKHAVVAFADGLRREIFPRFKINVATIEPGFFKTPLLIDGDKMVFDLFLNESEEIQKQYGGTSFIKKQNQQRETFLSKIPSDPQITVDAMYKYVISDGKLPIRIVTGKDQHFFFRPLSLLSSDIQDLFFARL